MKIEVSQDAKNYRQKALTFAAKERSSIATCVSEALLNKHDGLHCVEGSGSSSSSLEGTYLPSCPQCGGPIQPGYEGVSICLIRQKALSRTQRRRLSRKTALRLKRDKATQNKSPALSLLGMVTLTEYSVIHSQPSTPHTLNHELQTSRNHVIVQCSCLWKLTLPGCPRSRSSLKGQSAQKGGAKGKVVPEANGVSQKKAKEFDQQNDFIAIGRLPKRKANGNEEKQTMPAGKKKKPKKSQLMDFLSSLNDR